MKTIHRLASVAAATVLAAGVTLNLQASQTLLIGNATAGDTQAAANDKFAELLTEYSDGQFEASARHGESLGGNAQMFPTLQAGSLHGMIFPAGFLAPIVPELSVLDMPFLLPPEPKQITAFAAQSEAAEILKELAEERGIKILGFHGIGPQSFLTRFPVEKLEDIRGKRFRVIPSPPRIGAYEDWGGVPRPMELGEVYTSLQQGTLDGMENPPDVIYMMNLHEAANYYTITEHFAFASVVIVSKRWFDSLTPDLQEAVIRAGEDTIAWADEAYTESQQSSLEAMRQEITVTEMPEEELEKMREAVFNGVWRRMEEDERRGDLIRILREDVERFEASSR